MKVSVGLAQIMGRAGDAGYNLELSLDAAKQAFADGADLVILPELIASGYTVDAEILGRVAEPVDGPAVSAWAELAAERNAYIAGGFCERVGDKLYNSTALVGPEGLLLHYRKLHLFDLEKQVFEPGDLGLPVADLPFGRVGMCVCYDLRFVEVVRGLSLQGADLICVSTAWLAGFDQQKWDEKGLAPQANGAILQANLCQVFVACASQPGADPEGLEFLGSSILAGPRGELRYGPMAGTEPGVAVIEIDLDEAKEAQSRSELITPRKDRRTDVYSLRVGDSLL